MARKVSKRTKQIIGSVGVVLAALVLTLTLINALKPKEQDPYRQETSKSQDASSDSTDKADASPDTNKDTPTQNDADNGESEPALDPETVSTIDILPMNISVSYVKGVGGFEYEVLRTRNRTQYVEFRSETLIGTKCTDDNGTFASILENPKDAEASTLAKTVTVDGVKYGLSLPQTNCTGDEASFKSYQRSFSDAFSLLKKLD